MIQRGEIVEATVAEYGWAVKPNKHSRFENFWVTIGTELQVTHVRNDGMLNVRFAAVGMDRAVFRFDDPHNARDLAHFVGLGYRSAPITEFGDLAVPGFVPSEIDHVIEAWRAAQRQEVA